MTGSAPARGPAASPHPARAHHRPVDRHRVPGPRQLFDVRYQETGTGRRTTSAAWYRSSNNTCLVTRGA